MTATPSDPTRNTLRREFRHLADVAKKDGFAQVTLQITPLCGFPLETTLLQRGEEVGERQEDGKSEEKGNQRVR